MFTGRGLQGDFINTYRSKHLAQFSVKEAYSLNFLFVSVARQRFGAAYASSPFFQGLI